MYTRILILSAALLTLGACVVRPYDANGRYYDNSRGYDSRNNDRDRDHDRHDGPGDRDHDRDDHRR